MGTLNGKTYRSDRWRPFRHLVYLGKYDLRGSTLEDRLMWIHSRKIWDNAADILCCPEYPALRDDFILKCRDKDIPIHNAIAFWAYIFDNRAQLSEWDLYILILSAACNYGDFFQYCIVREAPAALAWPQDLEALREPPSDKMVRQCREQILREVQNNPDLVTGTKNFDQFRTAWNTHLFAAKKYREWKIRYSNLKITGKEDNCDPEEVKQLVHIFHQYIHMLSERTNSNNYGDFEPCYKEFLAGKVNELLVSFQYIDSLLHTYDELAIIAPAYVLGIFQKDVSKLYQDWFSSKRSKKIPLTAFSNAKPKIKGKPNNSTAPREIQIIIYQLLCEFFGKIIHIPYDRDLCDYILQTFMPLVGLTYFDIDEETVCEIVHSGNCINKENFTKMNTWIHPLLEEIENRLSYSLYLYPDSIPKISFTKRRSEHENDWIKAAEKLVDDAFVKEYLRIFIIPCNGLGTPRITENIQEPLANLMDQTIVKSPKRRIQDQFQRLGAIDPEILLAYEKGFHYACTQKIYAEYHSKVLLFLYAYLQSEAFCHGKRIPTSEECRKAMQEGVKIWTIADKPAPPQQIVNYRTNRLNVDNREV